MIDLAVGLLMVLCLGAFGGGAVVLLLAAARAWAMRGERNWPDGY